MKTIFLLVISAFILGYGAEKFNLFEKYYSAFLNFRGEFEGKLTGKTMVALIIGQSNAANYCQNRYKAQNNVLNFYNGKYYRAKDPLLGASGKQGSIWAYLGDQLINIGLFDNVVLVPIAQGGTKVADWLPGGKASDFLLKTISELHENNLTPTHVIYSQGEQDNQYGTTKIQYQKDLTKLVIQLRDNNINSPIFITLTTFTPAAKNEQFINQDIRTAQSTVVLKNSKVYQGPDTDLFNKAIHRYDGIHLSDLAVKKIADEWTTIFSASNVTNP